MRDQADRMKQLDLQKNELSSSKLLKELQLIVKDKSLLKKHLTKPKQPDFEEHPYKMKPKTTIYMDEHIPGLSFNDPIPKSKKELIEAYKE